MKYFWKLISGWKLIAGYILLNVPGLTPHPLWASAVTDIAASINPQTVGTLIANIVALIGLIDRIRKNVQQSGINESNT